MAKHAVIIPHLRATIGGIDFPDCIEFLSSFTMNTIPTATLSVAVGRNVANDQLATIHTAVNQFKVQLPVSVYLWVEIPSLQQAVPGLNAGPENEIKIFEGKVVGTGWRRSEDGANFVITILHWLGDLNYASAVSASMHPGSPADLAYPAIFDAFSLNQTDPTAGNPSWVPAILDTDITSASLEDLWGLVLYPYCQKIVNFDPFDAAIEGGNDGKGHPDVIAAVERLKPNETDGKQLKLKSGGADRDVIAAGLRQSLIEEVGGSWINTTLWGKLVGEWAPAYQFSVIPRVEDTLIVPFTGGLQGEPWAVIGDEDYTQCSLDTPLHQVLKAVGILHPTSFYSGVDMNRAGLLSDRGGFAGFFEPEDVELGMILIKRAPKWLSDPIIPDQVAAAAEGLDGNAIGTVLDEENTGNDAENYDPAGQQSAYKELLSQYARQWYVLEALKGRVGEIAGKLRFDICPGSNILVEAGQAANDQEASNLQTSIYATVVSVNYMINSETEKVGTTFSLAHLRSEKENTLRGFSIDVPPLYEEAWPGAKLVTAAPGPEVKE